MVYNPHMSVSAVVRSCCQTCRRCLLIFVTEVGSRLWVHVGQAWCSISTKATAVQNFSLPAAQWIEGDTLHPALPCLSVCDAQSITHSRVRFVTRIEFVTCSSPVLSSHMDNLQLIAVVWVDRDVSAAVRCSRSVDVPQQCQPSEG